MYNGYVILVARVKGKGLSFSPYEFDPKEPRVTKVTITGSKSYEIHSTVYFKNVENSGIGKALAVKVVKKALDRIAYKYLSSIDNAEILTEQFNPINPQSGGPQLGPLTACGIGHYDPPQPVNIDASALKLVLEQTTSLGERYYGFLRSACQSTSPVEEFMHLYHILLMIFKDKQVEVEAFIIQENPSMPLQDRLHPQGKKSKETVYTRLRNEFAHTRPEVNLDNTKEQMVTRVSELRNLTKRAIELHS